MDISERTYKAIFKNTLFLSTGKVLGDLCSFLFLAYLGRTFGTTTMGQYAFAMSIGGILTIFSSFGFNTYTIREVSKHKSRNRQFVSNFLAARGIVSLSILAIFAAIVLLSSVNLTVKYILIFIAVYQVLIRLASLFRSSFIAFEQMEYSAFLELFHKLLIVILGAGFIFTFDNPVLALTVYPISGIAMLILANSIFKGRFGRLKLELDKGFLKNAVQKAAPFFVLVVLAQVYDRIGIVLLTYLKGEVETGIFAASDRILATAVAGLYIFHTALIPAMAKLSTTSPEKIFELGQRAYRIVLIVLIPIILCLYISSAQIISITFGSGFKESVIVLQTGAWSLIFIGVNLVMTSYCYAVDKQIFLMKTQALVYFSYIIFCVILIDVFGYIGLVWSKIITEILLFTLCCWFVLKRDQLHKILSVSLSAFIACCICLAAYNVLFEKSLLVTLPAILIIYFFTMLIFDGIHPRDFKYLKAMIAGKNRSTLS